VSQPGGDSSWRVVDDEAAWAPFDERFRFEPDFHERGKPAIRLHPESLCVWGDELVDSLGAELLTWLPRHRWSPL
jgi:hypothetical protein